MTQLGFEPRTFGLSHRRSTNWATVSVGRTWIYPYKLSHIIKSLRRYLSLLWTLLNDIFLFVFALFFSLDVHIWFCLFSIVFLGCWYVVIRIKVVEFIAKCWKVQFRLGLAINSTTLILITTYQHPKNTILYVYTYISTSKSLDVVQSLYFRSNLPSLYIALFVRSWRRQLAAEI